MPVQDILQWPGGPRPATSPQGVAAGARCCSPPAPCCADRMLATAMVLLPGRS